MSKKFVLVFTVAMVGCTGAQLKTALDMAGVAACIAVKPVCTEASRVCGPVLGTSGGETP